MKDRRLRLCVALLVGLSLCSAAVARSDDAPGGTNVAMPDPAISTISDPNDALRHARASIDGHDIQGAVVTLQRYIINHPGEANVERFLGNLYFSTGDLRDAEATYRDMIDTFPLDNDLHYRLGELFVVEDRIDEAMTQFQASLPDVQSIYFLVLLHHRKGDLAEFRRQMEQNADAHPQDANAQIEAAQLFGALYEPRDAAIEFSRALAVSPNSLDALEGLALAQTEEGAYDAAAGALARCLSLDPSNYGCLVALGTLDVQTHDYDDAQGALERAYNLAPEAPEALTALGRLADARGDWQHAITWYSQSIYVWRYGTDAYVPLAFDYEEHGMRDKAQDVVLQGLTIAPDDGRMHYMLGYLYREGGQQALALAQFVAAEDSLDPVISHFAKQSVEALGGSQP